jgi:hypothetical protein
MTKGSDNALNRRTLINEGKTIYHPINRRVNNTIVVGVITTRIDLKILQNKKTKVSSTRVGEIYKHQISYDLENPCQTIYNISSRDELQEFMILIRIDYKVPFGVGTKFCNMYGQKDEIADVRDLSMYAAMKEDGTWIKPQILMSAISLIGRTASGQSLEAMHHPDRAFTPKGGLVAPSYFFVSSIHASTKINDGSIRLDPLKSANGFDGNELTTTNLILNKQNQSTSRRDALSRSLSLGQIRGVTFKFQQRPRPY